MIEVDRAARLEPAPRAAQDPHRACRRRERRDRATWFNQPWLEAELTPGTRSGCAGDRTGTASPSRRTTSGEAETADFAPVYPSTEDLAQKKLASSRAGARARARRGGAAPCRRCSRAKRCRCAPTRSSALHRPRTLDEAEVGRSGSPSTSCSRSSSRSADGRGARGARRGAAAAARRAGRALPRVAAVHADAAQEHAIAEIDADLARSTPMQRLLQGDVGSGKTAVALYALLRAVEAGRQGALMAPTETLAEQHFLTIEGLCTPLGVRVALLTSSLGARERRAVRQLIASGDVPLAVGTHALIQREVDFRDLAVAVVDEQHRFGVGQRAALAEGRSPHVLHMTATPIPRTLALTVYGDLRLERARAPPANRKPIVTGWVTEDRSSEAYPRLRRHLDDGRQAYVVCPLIEASETTRRARCGGGGGAAARRRAPRLPRRLRARPAARPPTGAA